jgi:hypothetical protein
MISLSEGEKMRALLLLLFVVLSAWGQPQIISPFPAGWQGGDNGGIPDFYPNGSSTHLFDPKTGCVQLF